MDVATAMERLKKAEALIEEARKLIGDGELIVAQADALAKAKERLVALQLRERATALGEQIVEILSAKNPTSADLQRAIQLLVLRFLLTGERRIGDIGAGVKQIMDTMGRVEPNPEKDEGGEVEYHIDA
ncbi:MAG: hypothetical protein ABC578_06175 [Candidatus Methanosuratincola petrocarbonis]